MNRLSRQRAGVAGGEGQRVAQPAVNREIIDRGRSKTGEIPTSIGCAAYVQTIWGQVFKGSPDKCGKVRLECKASKKLRTLCGLPGERPAGGWDEKSLRTDSVGKSGISCAVF